MAAVVVLIVAVAGAVRATAAEEILLSAAVTEAVKVAAVVAIEVAVEI